MDSCPELKEDINDWVDRILAELSYHYIQHLETNFEETRQLFVKGVLTESLSDGTPKYYNSNIL